MAMFPALINDTMFADLFDDPFFEGWRSDDSGNATAVSGALMNTDVRETGKAYDVDIDMPGFDKKDINVELNNGYLTISAHKGENHDNKDDSGRWLRRERYVGTCSRSFYVGDGVKESDIHASYKNGTLCLEIPKTEADSQIESKHQIAIEG